MKDKVEAALRHTFRRFTLLKRNVKNEILHDLMQFDIDERAQHNLKVARIKWDRRLGVPKEQKINNVESTILSQRKRILPRLLRELINLHAAKCPHCTGTHYVRCSREHMKDEHQINIPCYEDIMYEIEARTIDTIDRKLPRKEGLEYVGSFLKEHVVKLSSFLSTQPSE